MPLWYGAWCDSAAPSLISVRITIGELPMQRLEEALPGVAGDPLALAHHDERPAGEAAVGLGHRRPDRLLAHLDRADRRVAVEAREDRPGVAAGHAEHVLDPGLGQHVHDGVGDTTLLLQRLTSSWRSLVARLVAPVDPSVRPR